MENPFQFEKLPSPENFFGREQEAERLRQLILDGKNVLLFGDRRYGKTSLIYHVFQSLPDTKLHAFADLFSCVESYDVAVAMYKAVYKALPFSIERKTKELMSAFKRLSFEMQPTSSGSLKFSPKPLSRDFDELIEDALLGAERICEKHNKSLVIALDEFQQVAEIKDKRIDAVLRTHLQKLKYISFVFSGSKKSILSNLFINRQKPLYGMSSSISISGIEMGEFKQYCEQRLETEFEPGVFEHLYERTRGQTKLILQTGYWLYANQLALTFESVNQVIDLIIAEKDEEFRLLFSSYSALQRKVLKMVGTFNGRNLFTKESLERFDITKQSLNQVLTKLIDVGDLQKQEDDTYVVSDVHFHLWIVKSLGGL
ncbi:AAA family ATPase [Gynuella sp.]|uniref:AAA family ATPase n=1 Tax=Gynuella sp. TaxID=2969146 RepID=UPI003D131E91